MSLLCAVQLADLSCQLDETRRKLIVRESELARLDSERERERTPRASPVVSHRDAAELRMLRVKHRELQVRDCVIQRPSQIQRDCVIQPR